MSGVTAKVQLADLAVAGLQRQRAVGGQLAGELPRAPVAGAASALQPRSRCRARALRRDLATVPAASVKASVSVARAAGHPQRQVAAFGHGERRRSRSRRLACRRSGRPAPCRYRPAASPRRRCAAARVSSQAARGSHRPSRPPSGPKEKAKAVTSSSAAAARRPHGSRSGTRGARQVAADAGQACRPCGAGVRATAPRRKRCPAPLGRSVCTSTGVCASWLARFDAAVDLGRRRRAVEAQRIERGQRSQAEDDQQAEPRHVGQHAEDAEPGQAEEQADDQQQGQDERPAAFDDRSVARTARRVRASLAVRAEIRCWPHSFPSSTLPVAARSRGSGSIE